MWCFVIPKLINAWMPELRHFSVKQKDFAFSSRQCTSELLITLFKKIGSKSRIKTAVCVGETLMCLIKMSKPETVKLTQYLEAFFLFRQLCLGFDLQ